MLLENKNIKQGFAPKNLNGGATTGNRVSMAGVDKLAIVVSLGTSLTGAAVAITLRQHNAASAGTSKVLAVAHPYYKKAGAATKFTKVEQSVANSLYTVSSDFDTAGGLVVFEIDASDLDVDGGFSHVSVDLATAGVDKEGAALYILNDVAAKPAYNSDI